MNRRLRQLHRSSDQGAAVLVAVLIGALLLALAATMTTLSVNNLRNADRDRQGQTAMDAADAGVSAAVEYLRTHPFSSICNPSLPGDPDCNLSKSWSPSNPAEILADGRRTAAVSLTVRAPADPLAGVPYWTFDVTSVGETPGGGERVVTSEIRAVPMPLPIGAYAESVDATGSGRLDGISLISPSCIELSGSFETTGNDLFYGGPARVKSTVGIVKNGKCSSTNDLVSGVSCTSKNAALADPYGTPGSGCYFDDEILASYGYQAGGISAAQEAALKSIAQAQGTYFGPGESFDTARLDPSRFPNAVIFIEPSSASATFSLNEISGYESGFCGQRSVVIYVKQGDVAMNAGTDIVGALIAPRGSFRFNGKGQLTGSIFVEEFQKFNGTADLKMRQCWLDNIPGGLMDMSVANYRQVDSAVVTRP